MTLSRTIPRDDVPVMPSTGVTLLLVALQPPDSDMVVSGPASDQGGNSIASVTTPQLNLDASRQRRAALALASTQRDLHRYALETLGATLSGDVPAGGHSACARRTMFLAKRTKIMSIILDRALGATWEAIGRQWGLAAEAARQLFGPMEQAWADGDPAPWAPRMDDATPAGMMPIRIDAEAGTELGDYYWGHAPRPLGPTAAN